MAFISAQIDVSSTAGDRVLVADAGVAPHVPNAAVRPPRRVALFASSYNYIKDGVALTLNRLVDYLEKHGVEVLVFTAVAKTAALEHVGTIVPVPSIPLPARPEYRFTFGLPKEARDQLRAFKPDLIHVAFAPDLLGFSALRLAKRLGIPIVASCHTRYETYLKHYWYVSAFDGLIRDYTLYYYGACREVYVPSQSMADALVKDHARATLRLWPRGVDTERFNPAKKSGAWRSAHGIGDDEVVVSFVSRLVREKELDTLVRMFKLLEGRGVAHRALIVGDGPERETLQRQLPNAVFTGFLHGEDLAKAYAASDVFVFPSETETFGSVTLEAMASGLACVCADATGSRSLVVPGETGYLIEPRNAEAFAEQVALLARDTPLRREMGAAAHRRSLAFSWDEAMATILGYYRSLLVGDAS